MSFSLGLVLILCIILFICWCAGNRNHIFLLFISNYFKYLEKFGWRIPKKFFSGRTCHNGMSYPMAITLLHQATDLMDFYRVDGLPSVGVVWQIISIFGSLDEFPCPLEECNEQLPHCTTCLLPLESLLTSCELDWICILEIHAIATISQGKVQYRLTAQLGHKLGCEQLAFA